MSVGLDPGINTIEVLGFVVFNSKSFANNFLAETLPNKTLFSCSHFLAFRVHKVLLFNKFFKEKVINLFLLFYVIGQYGNHLVITIRDETVNVPRACLQVPKNIFYSAKSKVKKS
jgi:hypothetical protein